VATAAIIIIGDEILSGKVQDLNSLLLIQLFREVGVTLERLVFVADDLEAIADEVRRCSEMYDTVITSGGVGPTHDDLTIASVAQAFGVPVVRDPGVENMIRTYWGSRLTEAALRMADMPEGGRLLDGSDGLLPLVCFRNVYMLPGVPQLFEVKVRTLRRELSGQPLVLQSLYLSSDESQVAPLLAQVDDEFPAVKVGSYPRFGHGDHRLWITLEATAEDEVRAAAQRLLELLPRDQVVRVEPEIQE
jgi:molybdenum cofactor synthesis domain-containing protein